MMTLLSQAKVLGIEPQDLVEFFGVQINAMLGCPPNYNYMGEKANVWILRGYYPGYSLFFKLVLVKKSDEGGYYAKASALEMKATRYLKGKKTRVTIPDNLVFNGKEMDNLITSRMENSILGAKHDIEALLPFKIKMPKCMSPRGMKLFKHEKSKSH
jgi:hypothetical protein